MQKQNILVGIDINNGFVNISIKENEKITHIDVSSGYGKPAFPTCAQFLKSSNQWVFGESAIDNEIYEDTYYIDDLFLLLDEKKDFIIFNTEKILLNNVFFNFFSQIIQFVFNIIPNANIDTIYFNYKKYQIILNAFEKLGINQEKIKFLDFGQPILFTVLKKNPMIQKFSYIYLDDKTFSISSFFGDGNCNWQENKVYENNLALDFFDKFILDILIKEFKSKTNVSEISDNDLWQIKAIVYYNKDIIFNKYLKNQNAKIYFNFLFPPISVNINTSDIHTCFFIYEQSINLFIKNHIVDKNQLIYVFGKGFDNEIIKKVLLEKINFKKLNLLDGLLNPIKNINIIDDNIFLNDIGIFANEVFVPIIKKGEIKKNINSQICVYFLDEKQMPIEIFEKIENEFLLIDKINFNSNNITKIKIMAKFNNDKLDFNITNLGFGEFYE